MASEDKYYIIDGTLVHADQIDELYHYGRPGMEWGKHLPGTDWWKEKVGNISKQFKSQYRAGVSGAGTNYQIGPSSYGSNYGTSKRVGLKDKAKAAVSAAGSTAKYVGQGLKKYAKKLPGHMVNEARNIGKNIKADYADARAKYSKKIAKNMLPILAKVFDKTYKNNKFSNLSGNTKLEKILQKEYGEAYDSYIDATNRGTAGRTINSFIQNAQYSVLNGVNDFLKSLKIDDDVDRIINKFNKKK